MLWIKAFHIIAMVAWFAGLFYLPRLFVYHAMSQDETSIERFKIMERKLYYSIMTPSAILTLGLGIWLATYYTAVFHTMLWLHIKLILVILLILYHLYCGKLLKDFKNNNNRHSHIYYRVFNEIPALFLIAIVLLAVIKPAII